MLYELSHSAAYHQIHQYFLNLTQDREEKINYIIKIKMVCKKLYLKLENLNIWQNLAEGYLGKHFVQINSENRMSYESKNK